MFTINIYLRFALIALFLGGGIALAFAYGFWYASLPILVGLILLVGYIAFGTVISAGQIAQTQDFAGAEKRLELTLKPEWLYSTNRAMYYMMRSSFEVQKNNNAKAEEYLDKASDIKLNTDNEKGMIEFQLAGIAAKKGNFNKVKIHLKNLKALNITEPALKEQVVAFEKMLKQSGGGRQANIQRKRGMGYQPGGKRRRPKMR